MAESGPSGHLLKFVNAIADAVYEVYPEIKVETLSYAEYFEVPTDDTVPAHNVVIRLASSDMDIMHSLDHINNRKPDARLKAWGELLQPGQLLYWDYGMMTNDIVGTMPNFFRFAEDYQKLYENNGCGVFLENGGMNRMEMWDARAWIAAKIIEDPYQDIYEVAKVFTNGYYGKAAGQDIYNYMVFMEQGAASYTEHIRYGSNTLNAPWMSAVDVMKANGYFDAAVKKTKADPSITEEERQLYLNRINAARTALDRTILNKFETYAYEIADAGGSFGMTRQEVGRRLVAGMQWLDSLAAGEDLSGVQDLSRRGSYDGSAKNIISQYLSYKGELAGDGTMWWPELPEQVLIDYPDLSPLHIHDLPAAAFSYDSAYATKVVNGASFDGGSAVMVDQAKAIAAGLSAGKVKFSTTNPLNINLSKPLYMNDPLMADGQYHLYKLEDVTVYGDSIWQIEILGAITVQTKNLKQLKNKPADVYLSMKIEGDPAAGTAKIYIDRLVVVEDCTD